MKAAGASSKELNHYISEHSPYQAQVLGDSEGAELHSGQGAGLIKSVESAAEVIRGIASTIHSHLDGLKHKLTDFL